MHFCYPEGFAWACSCMPFRRPVSCLGFNGSLGQKTACYGSALALLGLGLQLHCHHPASSLLQRLRLQLHDVKCLGQPAPAPAAVWTAMCTRVLPACRTAGSSWLLFLPSTRHQ